MHIAHFTNTYYPFISGVVRSVSAFRKALTGLGHNVFVFAQNEPEYQDQEPFIFRYPAFDLGLPNDFPATIPFSPYIDYLFPVLKVDVVHSHHPVLLGQAASNKAQEYNLPLVFTFHTRYRDYSHYFPLNQDFVQEFVKNTIDSWLRIYIRRCQHIVVPSESIREILVREYGVTGFTTVVPTGVELEPFETADGASMRQKHGWADDFVLISVGRLAKEKNWGRLLEAVSEVIGVHQKVRLVVLGDGPHRKALARTARQLGIAGRVEFAGKVPFEDVPRHLKASDLFCFASLTETQGLVTVEAMAAGLPVVAVDATGTRDVVEDGIDGLLVPDDSQALARAINRVIEDEPLRRRLKAGAEKKARAYSIQSQAEELMSVYEKAIAAKKAGLQVPVDGESR
ncbi:MAG TPA: glycosyltransferase [Anaerolineales bacterium]|nr:glycosyltransferase [Anaerolineales bacterium]